MPRIFRASVNQLTRDRNVGQLRCPARGRARNEIAPKSLENGANATKFEDIDY
jgi:hypothetical protein